MEAEFKVIKVDPEGSGLDWGGHLGATIYHARRCCRNCSVIFGSFTSNRQDYDPTQPESASNDPTPVGPFIPGELAPLNQAARDMIQEMLEDHPAEAEFFSSPKPSTWQRFKQFVLGFLK